MNSKRVCLTYNPGRDGLSCPAPGGFPGVEGLLPGIYEKPVEVKKYKNRNSNWMDTLSTMQCYSS